MRYIFGILSRDEKLNTEEKYQIVIELSRFNKENKTIRDIEQINVLIVSYRAKNLTTIDEKTKLEIDQIIDKKSKELINLRNQRFVNEKDNIKRFYSDEMNYAFSLLGKDKYKDVSRENKLQILKSLSEFGVVPESKSAVDVQLEKFRNKSAAAIDSKNETKINKMVERKLKELSNKKIETPKKDRSEYSTELKYAFTYVASDSKLSKLTNGNKVKLFAPLKVFGKVSLTDVAVGKRIKMYKQTPFTAIDEKRKDQVVKIINDSYSNLLSNSFEKMKKKLM